MSAARAHELQRRSLHSQGCLAPLLIPGSWAQQRIVADAVCNGLHQEWRDPVPDPRTARSCQLPGLPFLDGMPLSGGPLIALSAGNSATQG